MRSRKNEVVDALMMMKVWQWLLQSGEIVFVASACHKFPFE